MDSKEKSAVATEVKPRSIEYDRVVERYLPSELRGSRHPVKVTEVGCGHAFGLSSFSRIIGENMHYRGIDINPLYVKGATFYNRELLESSPHILIEEGDVRSPEILGGKEDVNDLVILRNPQVHGSYADRSTYASTPEDWKKILDNSVSSLRIGGYFFITTQTDDELDTLIDYLKKRNVNFTEFGEEIYPTLPGGFPEKFVAVLKVLGK